MRTATTLTSSTGLGFHEEALPTQLPLPLPGTSSIVPVPVTRDGDEEARVLRAPVARLMQAIAEVLSGERPARQLSSWMDPRTHAELVARLVREAGARPRRSSASRIASVHLSVVGQHAVEIAGRMVQEDRSRAIAVRLELVTTPQARQVWTCTALTWA